MKYIYIGLILMLSSCTLVRLGDELMSNKNNYNPQYLKSINTGISLIDNSFFSQYRIAKIENQNHTDKYYFGEMPIFGWYSIPNLTPGHYIIYDSIYNKGMRGVAGNNILLLRTWFATSVRGVWHFEIEPGDISYLGFIDGDYVTAPYDSSKSVASIVVRDKFDEITKEFSDPYFDKYPVTRYFKKKIMKLSPLPKECFFYISEKEKYVYTDTYLIVEDPKYPKTPENILKCNKALLDLFESEKVGKKLAKIETNSNPSNLSIK